MTGTCTFNFISYPLVSHHIDILTGISLKISQENPFSTHISVHLLSPANTIIYFKAGYWENHYKKNTS